MVISHTGFVLKQGPAGVGELPPPKCDFCLCLPRPGRPPSRETRRGDKCSLQQNAEHRGGCVLRASQRCRTRTRSRSRLRHRSVHRQRCRRRRRQSLRRARRRQRRRHFFHCRRRACHQLLHRRARLVCRRLHSPTTPTMPARIPTVPNSPTSSSAQRMQADGQRGRRTTQPPSLSWSRLASFPSATRRTSRSTHLRRRRHHHHHHHHPRRRTRREVQA